MHNLKSALGKQDKKPNLIYNNVSQSIKKFSKNKSQSIWSIEAEHQNQNQDISLENDHKLNILNRLLKNSYNKDNNITSSVFERVVEQFQDEIISVDQSASILKSEISYFLVLQDKLTDLIETYCQKDQFFHSYLQRFHELVEGNIHNLRNSKDKKNSNKVRIPQINNQRNFNKKTEFLQVNNPNIKSRQKSSQRTSSTQNKLNRLLSKQKINTKIQQTINNNKKQQIDDYLINQTIGYMKNESVSFSTVMSTSVAIKQRRPRKGSGQLQDDNYMFKNYDKKSAIVENQEDNDKTDKAFIFFRPKKSKKN